MKKYFSRKEFFREANNKLTAYYVYKVDRFFG